MWKILQFTNAPSKLFFQLERYKKTSKCFLFQSSIFTKFWIFLIRSPSLHTFTGVRIYLAQSPICSIQVKLENTHTMMLGKDYRSKTGGWKNSWRWRIFPLMPMSTFVELKSFKIIVIGEEEGLTISLPINGLKCIVKLFYSQRS